MVEIMFEDNNWGATPRVFYSEAEANAEIALQKLKYPFISKCRVVTRKEKEKDYPHRGAKTMDMIEEIKETLTMEVRPNSKDFEYLEAVINRKDLKLLNS